MDLSIIQQQLRLEFFDWFSLDSISLRIIDLFSNIFYHFKFCIWFRKIITPQRYKAKSLSFVLQRTLKIRIQRSHFTGSTIPQNNFTLQIGSIDCRNGENRYICNLKTSIEPIRNCCGSIQFIVPPTPSIVLQLTAKMANRLYTTARAAKIWIKLLLLAPFSRLVQGFAGSTVL